MTKSNLHLRDTSPLDEAARGWENLETMREAPRYLSHIGSLVSQHIPPDGLVVELGAGDGSQTSYIAVNRTRLICVEQDGDLRVRLRKQQFGVVASLEVLPADSYAAAFSINCLEHIKNDLDALKQMTRVVKKGAPIIVFVPAFPLLFSAMDRKVGHYRRYQRKELQAKFAAAGLRVTNTHFVDSLGVIASFLYRFTPGQSGTPRVGAVKLYDRYIFPMSRQLDRLFGRFFGKNLLVVGEKI